MMIDAIVLLFNEIERLNLNYRIQLIDTLEVSVWDHFLIFPTPNYIECRYGIFPLRAVRQIQINSIENRYIGQRVALKCIDHSELLEEKMQQSGLHYHIENQIFTITLQK
ncbi:DUF6678 family protein [Acinetobacter bereziniae]|uniref:DUF6678 family protein n=2 Tax=Acinetobacter bereziniae TaxID=106648 RepID=UPI001D1792BF|nr:DUF6678 family protein [Acinetobacter bereziniae]